MRLSLSLLLHNGKNGCCDDTTKVRHSRARTLAFTIMAIVQHGHTLTCRHERRSVFTIGVWTNKPLLWVRKDRHVFRLP